MTIKQRPAAMSRFMAGAVCAFSVFGFHHPVIGQTAIPLNDMSAFKNPGKNWSIASDVNADPSKSGALTTAQGTGILVNIPVDHGADLYSVVEHGDADLEFDYIMAKGSNSGVYLQGRYELQLLDSWGTKNPKSGDNGGIYERWDESKPEGQKGYEGYAPRQNASKAPGLWQHMKVSFQAPRFDASGRKIENAKILRLELNGVVLHENIELSGPTRGAMGNDEVASGPLRFQGDHGAVAFKNIQLVSYNKARPEFTDVKYEVYKGQYQENSKTKLPPEAQGTLPVLSASNINKVPGQYFIKYTGTIKIKEPGAYNFNLYVPGGRGLLKINNETVNPGQGRNQRGGGITLAAGDFPFELLYAKTQDWTNRSLTLAVSGPGVREYLLGDVLAGALGGADPIFVDAPVNTILRSFMDIPGAPRVVHAVNVGSPELIHYTYDMDNAAVVQVWRGGFLDATPMWYSRGDGSSRPVGAALRFGKPSLLLNRLTAADASWSADSTGSSYIPKGYKVDKNDLPTFRYSIYGATVEDAVRVSQSGEGVTREINVQNAPGDLYARIAEAGNIVALSNGLYIIDDKSYYIRVDNSGSEKPQIREKNGRKELIVPVKSKLTYSILF